MLSYALLIVFPPPLLLLLLLDRQHHHHHHHHHHLQQVLPPIWWCIAAIYIRFTYMHVLVYVVYYNINDVEMGIKEKGKAYSIMELAWFYWFRCVRGCSYENMKAINDCLPIQACYYYIRVVFPVYIVPCRLFCVIIRGARGRSGGRRSILCTKRCGTGLKLCRYICQPAPCKAVISPSLLLLFLLLLVQRPALSRIVPVCLKATKHKPDKPGHNPLPMKQESKIFF